MGPYEIKGLNAALLCCHGGRAEHKDWFFEEYYSSLLKSFIPTFKDRYRSVSSNKTARYIIPTYHVMKLMFLNRRYEPYFN